MSCNCFWKTWVVSQDSSHNLSVLTVFNSKPPTDSLCYLTFSQYCQYSQTEVCFWFVCLWKFLQHIKLVQYQHRGTAIVQHRIYCWCFCVNSWLMGNRGTTSLLSLLLLYVIHRCSIPVCHAPPKHWTCFHILFPPESGIMSHFQSKSVLISCSWYELFFSPTFCLV